MFSVCVDIIICTIAIILSDEWISQNVFRTLQNEMQTVNEEANKAIFQHSGNDPCIIHSLILLS